MRTDVVRRNLVEHTPGHVALPRLPVYLRQDETLLDLMRQDPVPPRGDDKADPAGWIGVRHVEVRRDDLDGVRDDGHLRFYGVSARPCYRYSSFTDQIPSA